MSLEGDIVAMFHFYVCVVARTWAVVCRRANGETTTSSLKRGWNKRATAQRGAYRDTNAASTALMLEMLHVDQAPRFQLFAVDVHTDDLHNHCWRVWSCGTYFMMSVCRLLGIKHEPHRSLRGGLVSDRKRTRLRNCVGPWTLCRTYSARLTS